MGRGVAARQRKPRRLKYSYDALKVLQRVWAASGGQCGKYLAASMALQVDGLERHGELVFGRDRYSPQVRQELLTMSAASIDRYLKTAKATDQTSGASTTKPSPLLRNSIQVRRAGDEVEAEPGFFEGDTVAHCGPTLKGEFARTLNLTDVHTGWVFTRSVRNNAHVHILTMLKTADTEIPYEITGLDFDNGGEFLNVPVITWAGAISTPTGTVSTPPRSAVRSPTCRTDSSCWPRRKPNSSTSPASPPPSPTSAKASESGPAEPPVSRAFLTEAWISFRGHLDLRHYGRP